MLNKSKIYKTENKWKWKKKKKAGEMCVCVCGPVTDGWEASEQDVAVATTRTM